MSSSKTVVVYKTKYGSTKRYAEWIAEELKCDLFNVNDISIEKILEYDDIIYGGGLYASGMLGFKKLKNNYDKIKNKNIIVFSVGASEPSPETIEAVKNHNFTEEMKNKIKIFHLRGAFNLNKLNFLDRFVMKTFKKIIENKKEEDRREDEKGIVEMCNKAEDWTDKSAIAPIINAIKN